MTVGLAVVGGSLSTAAIGVLAATPSADSNGLIVAYIGAAAGLLASIAALISAFRGREPQIIVVHDEAEATDISEHRKRRAK